MKEWRRDQFVLWHILTLCDTKHYWSRLNDTTFCKLPWVIRWEAREKSEGKLCKKNTLVPERNSCSSSFEMSCQEAIYFLNILGLVISEMSNMWRAMKLNCSEWWTNLVSQIWKRRIFSWNIFLVGLFWIDSQSTSRLLTVYH